MVVLQFTVDALMFLAFHALAILSGIEFTLVKLSALPNVTVIAMYRSTQISDCLV